MSWLKITITLREDVYQLFREEAGARNISNLINKILIEYFAKKESRFGTMKPTNVGDLRDYNIFLQQHYHSSYLSA